MYSNTTFSAFYYKNFCWWNGECYIANTNLINSSYYFLSRITFSSKVNSKPEKYPYRTVFRA